MGAEELTTQVAEPSQWSEEPRRGFWALSEFERLPLLAVKIHDAESGHLEFPARCREPGPRFRDCCAVDPLFGKR
jgi:hypothetical protein